MTCERALSLLLAGPNVSQSQKYNNASLGGRPRENVLPSQVQSHTAISNEKLHRVVRT